MHSIARIRDKLTDVNMRPDKKNLRGRGDQRLNEKFFLLNLNFLASKLR